MSLQDRIRDYRAKAAELGREAEVETDARMARILRDGERVWNEVADRLDQ
jgi:hypothetical protein